MTGEEVSLDALTGFLLIRALDGVVMDLLASMDQPDIIDVFQTLAARHPTEVYGYLVEMLQAGGDVLDREAIKQQLGFHALPRPDHG